MDRKLSFKCALSRYQPFLEIKPKYMDNTPSLQSLNKETVRRDNEEMDRANSYSHFRQRENRYMDMSMKRMRRSRQSVNLTWSDQQVTCQFLYRPSNFITVHVDFYIHPAEAQVNEKKKLRDSL